MQINPQYLQRDVNLIRLQSRSFQTCSHLVVYCQVREVSSSPLHNLPSQTNIVEYTLEKNGQKQCCIFFLWIHNYFFRRRKSSSSKSLKESSTVSSPNSSQKEYPFQGGLCADKIPECKMEHLSPEWHVLRQGTSILFSVIVPLLLKRVTFSVVSCGLVHMFLESVSCYKCTQHLTQQEP